jgi:hypothetical protein
MSKARSTGNISNVIKTSTTCVTVTDGTTDLLIMSGSGRVTIPGDLVVLGGIAGSSAESASYSLSSSFATNANLLDGIDGASFLQTGSFNTFSSSIDTTIKNKLNGDGVISGSVQVDITSTTGYSTFSSSLSSSIGSLSGSVATTTTGLAGRIGTIEGRYATTGSNTFIGDQVITGSICSNGNIVTTGQIVAQTINVQQVTSSIVYSCGSNIFGTNINNTQTFTGSMFITGSNINASVGNTCFGGTICTTGVGFTSNANSNITEEYGLKLNLGGATSQYGAQFYNCNGTKVAQISATGIGCFGELQVCASSDPSISFYRNTCNNAVGIGRLHWYGADNVGTKTLYSYIQGVIESCGTTSYCSRFELYTACNGALSRNFQLNGVGVACFANTVCSPYLSTRSIEMGGSATSPSTACVGYGMFGYSGVGLGISATATGPNQGMGFFTCGDFERMRLTTSGNLGIGCTTPAYLLDVNGRTRLCGNVGIRVAPSSAGDQYLTTGDAGIAYTNSYFGTGQVRIGGGSDHASNTVFSVAPGVVTFDRPGVGGGALKIDGGGNVSINNATATAKFHAYGTTKLENYTYYGYAQSFVWQSVFNNPVQSLFTFNAGNDYSQTLIKVTMIQNGVSNGWAGRWSGFALAHRNPSTFNSSVTTMTAEHNPSNIGAPVLSWSGQTLQITPNRATNYDGYVVFIEWGSNINTNALPTVTM